MQVQEPVQVHVQVHVHLAQVPLHPHIDPPVRVHRTVVPLTRQSHPDNHTRFSVSAISNLFIYLFFFSNAI